MALQGNDLLVVQSQTDNKLYSLKVSDLDLYLEGSSGVQFRGSVDLNNAPAGQTPAVTLPAANGDLYIVESDADPIAAGWNMSEGETSAAENDRIIFDADDNSWVLVSGGSSTGGTLTGITASLPLKSDGDTVNPVLSIKQARTTADAGAAGDGEGTAGAVARLADNDDVKHTDGTGDKTAVVTADLLKQTNDVVEGLALAAGGVQTVTYLNSDGNDAILIPDTAGNVTLDIKNATDTVFGVVTIATASDITAGTAGATAVIDASQLKDAIDAIPPAGIQSITEGGTDVVTGALQIITDADGDTTIGVNKEVFCPYDFSSLTDINA